jgi:hypothetical protein
MTSTTNAVAPEDIMAFLDGELPAFDAQTVSAHLKEWAQCAMVAEHFVRYRRCFPAGMCRDFRWSWRILCGPWQRRLLPEQDREAETLLSRSTQRWKALMIGGGGLAVAALLGLVVFLTFWHSYPSPPSAALMDKSTNGGLESLGDRSNATQPAQILHAYGEARGGRELKATPVNADQLEASSMPSR